MRSCGAAMHISALPSPYGIGTFGKDADKFADWLKSAGQKYWQILPSGAADFDRTFSVFAGDPMLIDLDELAENGFISRKALEEADYGADPRFVDFDMISDKEKLLREAFAGFTDDVGYTSFVMEHGDWLEDFALFSAVKNKFCGKPWFEWEEDIKRRTPEAIKRYTEELAEEIKLVKFVQYIYYRQFDRLHRYCNKNEIRLIGDVPYYVPLDSADVWSQPQLFIIDENLNPMPAEAADAANAADATPENIPSEKPTASNAVYNWQEMHRTGYKWWLKRIGKAAENFDMLIINGFNSFGCCGENGSELFRAVKNDLGEVKIIAETSCEISEETKKILLENDFPETRTLFGGFNPENSDNRNLPHNYPKNCAAYTCDYGGAPIMQLYREADGKTRAMAKRYLQPNLFEKFVSSCIRILYQSPADMVIVPMCDILGYGREIRANTPQNEDGSFYYWRMLEHPDEKTAGYLKSLSEAYFR